MSGAGSLEHWSREFLRSMEARKMSPHTLKAYRGDLAGVSGFLGAQCHADVATLTPLALREAFAGFAQGHAAASVARAMACWGSFCRFMVRYGALPGSPMAALDSVRVPRGLPKPLRGEGSAQKLVQQAAAGRPRARSPWPARDTAVLVLLLTAGLRSAELLGMQVRDLLALDGQWSVRVMGKGSKERVVPLPVESAELVGEYLLERAARFGSPAPTDPLVVSDRGVAMGRGGLRYLVSENLRAAGLSGAVDRGSFVHSLRATYATTLAQRGAPATRIQALLGHASLVTSQVYVSVSQEELREEVAGSGLGDIAAVRPVRIVPAAGEAG